MPKTKPRAAIYVRISQDRDGASTATDRQAKDCKALARREGLDVTQVYEDADVSAYSGKRPAFEQMLGDLGRFDVLIYWKNDRLARRIKDFWRVVDACETAGVRLVSVVDPIDTSSPIGKGIAGMVAAMAEQESANTGLRVARKHEEAAREGRAHGRRRAYGYDKAMTVIPAEAEAIREARSRILAGTPMTAICTDWNARGIKPTTAPAWRVTTFKRMICGPHLAGLRVFRGEVVGKGDWDPILTEDDHRRIVTRLGDPKISHRGRPTTYLLTSFMRCGKCGAAMRCAVGHTPESRLWACRRIPGDDSHCNGVSITANPVNEIVEAAILERLASPALARTLRRTTRTAKRGTPTLATLEAQVTQLGIDHDEGLISRAEWLDRRARLLPRLEAAQAEVARDNGTAPLAGFRGINVKKRWDALDLAGRRAVVGALVEQITIEPATKGATFDPARIKVTWKA